MAVLTNGLETIELGATAWREVINQNFTELDDFIGSISLSRSDISLDTTNFDNNLDDTINTVQKLAQWLNDLDLSSLTIPTELIGGDSSTTDFDYIAEGGDSSTTSFDNIFDGETSL